MLGLPIQRMSMLGALVLAAGHTFEPTFYASASAKAAANIIKN